MLSSLYAVLSSFYVVVVSLYEVVFTLYAVLCLSSLYEVRVRYIMLENSSIMLLSVTQKNLVLCPKLCSKNIALCSPDFYCIQHVLITTV